MANEYATAAEFNAEATIEDAIDSVVTAIALEAASRQIDRYCHRRFWLDDEASARWFTASCDDDCPYVRLDDVGHTDGLVVAVDRSNVGTFGEVWAVDVDFALAPRNAASAGEPWRELRIPGWSTKRWPTRPESVKVAARWGWPAVPAEVKQATLIQAARLMKRKDSPLGVVGETGVKVTENAKLDPEAEALIAPYRLPVVA